MPGRRDPGYDEPLVPSRGHNVADDAAMLFAIWFMIAVVAGIVTLAELIF